MNLRKGRIWLMLALVAAGLLIIITMNGGVFAPSSQTVSEEQSGHVDRKESVHGIDYSAGEQWFRVLEQDTAQLAPGVVYERVSLEGNGVLEGHKGAVNLLAVDMNRSELTARVVSADERLLAMKTVTGIAADYEKNRDGQQVVAGFNLDFFDMSNGMPRGLQITDGELLTTPDRMATTFAVLPDNSFIVDLGMQVNIALRTGDGKELAIDAINKVREPNMSSRAHLLSERLDRTTHSPDSGVEVVITPDSGSSKIVAGGTFTGTVTRIAESGNTPIPAGAFILSASGSKAAWIGDHLAEGHKVEIQTTFTNERIHEAVYASGGQHSLAKPLVVGGAPLAIITNSSAASNLDRHPRTFLAKKDNLLYIITFDGRQPGYADGISLRDAARYLHALGMEYAVNVDGGGSTTFAGRLPDSSGLTVLNRPSDPVPRRIANALLITQTLGKD